MSSSLSTSVKTMTAGDLPTPAPVLAVVRQLLSREARGIPVCETPRSRIRGVGHRAVALARAAVTSAAQPVIDVPTVGRISGVQGG